MEHEIAKFINDSISEVVTERRCPHCGIYTSFITVHTLIEDPHKGYDSRDYLRCLKCLRLYREELLEVEDEQK